MYAVNYLINRNLSRKGGELVALFMDLRMAFDSVDKGKLMKAIKKVREGLVRRCEDLYREKKK